MFNVYPYLNENDLNLDYILKKMKSLIEAMANFEHDEKFKIANPIIFNIETEYERGTIVLDNNGNAYLSLKATSGHALSDGDYWQEIFDFALYVRTANSNLTLHIEEGTERATAAYSVGDWLLWDDVLYKVTAAIAVDDMLIIDTNIERFTVEQFCRAWVTYGTNLINQYKNDIDASELAYKNEMQAIIDQIIAGATVDSEVINARVEYNGYANTTLKNSIGNQILNAGFGASLNSPERYIQDDLYNTSDPDFLVGYGYSGTTGTIQVVSGADITGYVPIAIGDVISWYWQTDSILDNSLNENGHKIAFYDADKNWLKTIDVRSTPYSGPSIIADMNGYIRFSLRSSRTVANYHLYISRVGMKLNDNIFAPFNPVSDYPFIPCQWKYGTYNSSATFTNQVGKRRAFVLLDGDKINDGSIVRFDNTKYTAYYRMFKSDMSAQIAAGSVNSTGEMLITNLGYPNTDYKMYIQIDGVSSSDVKLSEVAANVGVYNKPKIVDVIIFSGQSNMAGRGNSTDGVPTCAGYEFRAISDPTRLYPIVDPFGVNENVVGAIDDANKSGSCVPRFVTSYYASLGRTVVGISASDAGTGIDDWAKNSARYDDMLQRYTDCMAYLTTNGYKVDRTLLVWHQGEHDYAMTENQYYTKFKQFVSDCQTDFNLTNFALIRVGTSPLHSFNNVIAAQTRVARDFAPDGIAGCVLIYANCASFESRGLLQADDLHYTQSALNEMGRGAGNELAYYYLNRVKPKMYDPFYDNIFTSKYN